MNTIQWDLAEGPNNLWSIWSNNDSYAMPVISLTTFKGATIGKREWGEFWICDVWLQDYAFGLCGYTSYDYRGHWCSFLAGHTGGHNADGPESL